MKFNIGDIVQCINGPFQGYSLVIDDNKIDKIKVKKIVGTEPQDDFYWGWCKYEWMELITDILREYNV